MPEHLIPVPDAPVYPLHMVPQPHYRLLNSYHVSGGQVLRRTSQPNVTDTMGKILPDQLSHPTEDLARHFSVNLLGDFQLCDAAWVLRSSPNKAHLASTWQPGEIGQQPSTEEAECVAAENWGYYWLHVAELHECAFTSIGENFICRVCHAPTRCNYWHFELHFHNSTGDVYYLEPKQRKKVAPKLRAWLQDFVHTYPLEAAPTAGFWPEIIYITAKSE
ncbi:hypothetical protein [uncultured Hymenobacter sp.]|uniref:hypothetical protein n=1 Tax=uncultured Hymenobacter sp. TaxID=170016 RepID=UPI0035CBA31C